MLKRIWTVLIARVARRIRRSAIRIGLIGPRVAYPFTEVMLKYPAGRANYRWGLLSAAFVARELGYKRISALEFGVAGGNGLVRMEALAAEAERFSGVAIDVYGFDTGAGLTKPQDYRDLPQLWKEGDFSMDVPLLRSRLKKASLELGPVAETVPAFLKKAPAPVGFISFDLDLYSSTMDAFGILEAETDRLLPRVVCYFDDIIGYSHSDFTGERLAIQDFNRRHEMRKISPIYGLRPVLGINSAWVEMMYMFHDFQHPRYNDFDGTNTITEIPID